MAVTATTRTLVLASVPTEALYTVRRKIEASWRAPHDYGDWPLALVIEEDSAADTARITLTGPMPSLQGWTIIAQHSNKHGLVPLDGYDASLPKIDADPSHCSVCGSGRRRSRWIVAANDSPDVRVVDDQCLPTLLSFAPEENPLAAARWSSAAARDYRKIASDAMQSVLQSPHFDTLHVIAAAIAVHKSSGYVSHSSAARHGEASTADLMQELMPRPDREEWSPGVRSNLLVAAILQSWAIEDLSSGSTFDQEMARTAARPTVSRYAFGQLAYLPEHHRLAMIKARAIAASLPIPGEGFINEVAGEKGVALAIENVLVDSQRELASGKTLVVFRDMTNRRLTWFTRAGKLPEVGRRGNIRAVVVSAHEYRGIASTTITRVRFAEQ